MHLLDICIILLVLNMHLLVLHMHLLVPRKLLSYLHEVLFLKISQLNLKGCIVINQTLQNVCLSLLALKNRGLTVGKVAYKALGRGPIYKLYNDNGFVVPYKIAISLCHG
jgi:hypothetical protein